MKNSNDTIGNRTCDLPTCKALPQSTALPQLKKITNNFQSYQKRRQYKPLINRKKAQILQTISKATKQWHLKVGNEQVRSREIVSYGNRQTEEPSPKAYI